MGIEQRIANQPVLNVAVAPYQDASGQPILSLDALVRSLGVRRGAPLALFLGAGASKSSGIPSAQMCIWEWKRQIFLTNNPGLEERFVELSLDGVRRRIQRWLDHQGCYPQEDAPEEYGFYVKHATRFPRTGAPILPGWFAKPGHISGTVCSRIWRKPISFVRYGRPILTALRREQRQISSSRRSRLALTRKIARVALRNKANFFAFHCMAITAMTSSKTRLKSCNNKKQPYGRPLLAN